MPIVGGLLGDLYNRARQAFTPRPAYKSAANPGLSFSSSQAAQRPITFGPPTPVNLNRAFSSGGLSTGVLGTSTGGLGGGGNIYGGGGGGGFSLPQIQQPAGPDQNILNLIDEDYNTTLGALQSQEEALKGQLPLAIQETQRQQSSKTAALKTEQSSRLGQISTREGEQQRATQGALEQLRNLYQTVQRQQQGQLSAGGISSSSASEALATLLGRDMAQRVAGEYGTQEQVLGRLADERKNVNDYFTTTVSNMEQETADRIQQTNILFQQQLGQLNQLRGQASVEKQRGRANLYQQFQSQIYAIQQANQNAQMALYQWQAQMDAKLQAAYQTTLNLAPAQTAQINQTSQLTPYATPSPLTQGYPTAPQGVIQGVTGGITQYDPFTGQPIRR